MLWTRSIRQHRAGVILFVLVSLCLASLITGTEATFIHTGIKWAVTVTAYPFLKAKDSLERATDYVVGVVFAYDALRAENTAMREELTTLKLAVARRAEVQQENQRLRNMLAFSREESRLTLEPVRVLECYKGMLRIDRGSLHGIKESMGVITPNGVVGIITEVSPFTAVVATLHHRECRIGAMVQRDRLRAYDGMIHAANDLSNVCTMDYIDLKDDVRVGDMAVTCPESVFPGGCLIGTISAVHPSGSLWKTAEVTPAVDPYRLDEVFIIHRAADSAQGAPETSESARTVEAQSPEMPDNRSIQERMAP